MSRRQQVSAVCTPLAQINNANRTTTSPASGIRGCLKKTPIFSPVPPSSSAAANSPETPQQREPPAKGHILNPNPHLVTPILPRSFRSKTQPYHNVALIIDTVEVVNAGVSIMKFNRHSDWDETPSDTDKIDGWERYKTSLRQDGIVWREKRKIKVPHLADILKDLLSGYMTGDEGGLWLDETRTCGGGTRQVMGDDYACDLARGLKDDFVAMGIEKTNGDDEELDMNMKEEDVIEAFCGPDLTDLDILMDV